MIAPVDRGAENGSFPLYLDIENDLHPNGFIARGGSPAAASESLHTDTSVLQALLSANGLLTDHFTAWNSIN